MSLQDYEVPTRTVPLGQKGQSVKLTGLSLEGIAILIREHQPDLEGIYEMFVQAEKLSDGDWLKMAASIASQAPGLVANIIAVSANEPESAPIVMKMPIPLQVDLLVAAGEMTFSEPGSVKKTLQMVMGLFKMTGSPTKTPKTRATRK